MDFRQAGNRAEQNIFNAWLRGGRDGNRISVATQTGSNPENVNFFDRRRLLRFSTVRNVCICHN